MICEREMFYENMIWIIDVAHKRSSFQRRGQTNEREFSFKWSYPEWSLMMCKKPIYLDFGIEKMLYVTKLAYAGGTGYYVDKDTFILSYSGMPFIPNF